MSNHMKHVFNPKKHKIYEPKNPDKCVDTDPIITRSSWEYTFCRWLDNNENVVRWGSEVIKIPYIDPITNKRKTYYPDFFMIVKNKNDILEAHVIEIKPHKQAVKPRNSKKKLNSQIIEENALFMRNSAKWQAATKWCDKAGIKFSILTEKELFK